MVDNRSVDQVCGWKGNGEEGREIRNGGRNEEWLDRDMDGRGEERRGGEEQRMRDGKVTSGRDWS